MPYDGINSELAGEQLGSSRTRLPSPPCGGLPRFLAVLVAAHPAASLATLSLVAQDSSVACAPFA